MFFSLFQMSAHIRFRQRITKKTCVFSAQRAHWIVGDFEKNSQFREIKKHSEKNKFISGDKKTFSSYVFFARFFRRPH